MKKIFALLLCVFITVAVFAASQTTTYYVDTEQKYVFSVDNLSQTIPEFVEDAAKQDAMASKYLELANKETGAVSVKDLFEICEAGGFKTRRAEGYESCRNFVVKLLDTVEQELEDGTLTGYCPENVLLENGKWLNGLKSITAETKVGDFCSSSNIAAGEVVFKKGYNCTCAAFACNSCCESKGGACLTKVADGNGNCLRKEYDNVQGLNVEGAALKFCENKAQRGCKVINAIKNFNGIKGKLVCNATQAEFDAVVALNTPCPDTAYALTNNNNTKEKCHSFCQTQTKAAGCKLARSLYRPSTKECVCNPDTETVRRLNMKYYQVCGKDKGKTGSQEICKDNLFTNKVYGGTQVSVNIAIALAKEWARKNGYREIECDTKPYEYNSLDDSILCSSIDPDKNGKRAYFDFVFDDVKESKDIILNDSFYHALAYIIYGYQSASNVVGSKAYLTGTEAKCTELSQALERMCGGGAGCSMKWRSVENNEGMAVNNGRKFCFINQDSDIENLNKKNSPEDFHNPFNIDPFMFCKEAQTQLQNTSSLDVLLRQYISNASGYPMSKIECFAKTIGYLGVGCKYNPHGFAIDNGDDIKRCVVHGDKDYYVDFVFDDITEFSEKREKGALQSMSCVVTGGTFNGQECKFANKQQCDLYISYATKVCPSCKRPQWNPDTQLCETPDAAKVTQMDKNQKTAMIVGGVVVSVVVTVATAGTGAPVVAIVLSSVEVAGGAMEYFAQQHIDGMAHEFFLKSAKCNNASCAAKMLSEDLQEMANIQNDLEDYEINALDAEFERLLGLIDPGSDFYMAIVEKGATLEDNQKGFFDPDGWNQAQVWRAVGIGLQFLSLGTGAITKIIGSARFGSKFPKMQAMLLKQVKITKKIRDAKKAVDTVDKTADATRNMTPSQAKKLDELNNDIAKIESKANRTPEEVDELIKLHQERNTLMNKVGTKDADELAKMQKEAFNQKDIQKAQEDYDKIMERRNYVAKYMAEHNGNPPKGTNKQVIREINESVSKAETKLKELGQEVTPMEPLQIGKKPTVKPVEGADAGKAADKVDNVADAGKDANKAGNKIRSDAELRNAVDEVFDNHLKEFKNSGKSKTFEKSVLSDDEWVALNKSLEKDNVKLVEKMDGVMAFERTDDVADAGKAVGKADNVADAGKGVNKAQNSNMSSIEEIENSLGSNYKNLKRELKTNPDRTLVFNKNNLTDEEWKILNESLAKENLEVVSSGESMFVRQKRVFPDAISDIRNRAYSEFNAHADNIKKGVEKELNIPKSHLSNDEWKALEADLNKEGLEITEANDHYFRVKKSTKANPVSNFDKKVEVWQVDNAASGAKNAEKNVNSVVKKSYKDFNWEYKSAAESGLKYSHRRVNLSDLTPNEIDFLKNDLTKQGISFEITSTNKGNLLVVRDAADASKSASSFSKNVWYADNIADAGKDVKPTKTVSNIVLDENELVRFKGNGGKIINKDYIQASKDARNFMNNAIESGEYTKSVDGYIESINDMHKVSANGANGNLNWYADAGQGSLDVNPGKIRGKIGRLSNGRVEEASRVEQIARKYGDPFSITKNSKVELPGIPRNNLPEDKIVDGHFRHVYPDGGDALRPYYEQMYRTSKEALELIDNQASERAILEKIAEHYQYAANARPYGQINNSLFMNEANTLLQKAGLRTMPHGELDHAAMHLQPDAFKRYFVDTYYATKL